MRAGVAKKSVLLLGSHLIAIALGFGLGIYALPILIAPAGPTDAEVRVVAGDARFSGTFRRDLADSDRFHWGKGTVFVGPETISLEGRLAPGPDYKLYLSPEFIETEADFNRLKHSMARVGDVKMFENFMVRVLDAIDPQWYFNRDIYTERNN